MGDQARKQIERLSGLVGTWRGEGSARFPGIDTASYREELRFAWIGLDPVLCYEQRTWWRRDEPLHWESGFLSADDEGLFTLLNSQNSGRVEVMKGRLADGPAGSLLLTLASTLHGNDARMLASTRSLALAGATLRYEVTMATTRVPQLAPHLEASLQRVGA
jgi:hypothetical protein